MLMMHALKNNYVQSAYRTSCWYSLPPFLYIYIGSYRSPSPSCVWCSVARFLLCWTGHLSHLPHCIHHHASCIQVSVDVTLIKQLVLLALSNQGCIASYLKWCGVSVAAVSTQQLYIEGSVCLLPKETFEITHLEFVSEATFSLVKNIFRNSWQAGFL